MREETVGVFYLLRILGTDIYMVAESEMYMSCFREHTDDNDRYYVEQHTCPMNLIGWASGIKAVLHRGDADPHGVFDFVQRVRKPDGYDENEHGYDYAFWRRIFDRLPEGAP